MIKKIPHNSSFRDPSGQVFSENGEIYRRINASYFQNYNHLINSGLYKKLIELNLIIPHTEIKKKDINIKTIKPQKIPFISYPYEWCFSEYKDAALTILKIQEVAMQYKMTLKDASAYNIQFFNGKPALIDTLSFEIYEENKPWIAYQQFCKHFLSPLLLMKFKDINLNKLMCIYIDGIPLQITSKLLPISTWLKFSSLSHIHLHSLAQNIISNNKYNHANLNKLPGSKLTEYSSASSHTNHSSAQQTNEVFWFKNKNNLAGIVENLYSTIQNLSLKNSNSYWSNYYNHNNYSQKAFNHKKQLVYQLLKTSKPKIVWDLGSNTGEFSFIATSLSSQTISIDNDHQSVENTYLKSKKMNNIKCLPLCIDLANPSPQIGWANIERQSLTQRGPADTILALALIHHLAIGNNLPFEKIASYLKKIGKSLIIEFIPKEDSQTQRLLKKRDDIFYDYNLENFKKKFSKYFSIINDIPIKSSKRRILFMESIK